MGSQWSRDGVYRKAVKQGYRSRAALKFKEIQSRFHIIREDDNVIDLGAAPGGWLQAVSELTTGMVIGIDLQQIAPIEGVITITGDFSDPAILERCRSLIGVANVVVSDAAPKLSGQRSYDQARAIALGEDALAFATAILKPGGNFIVKSFQGEDFSGFLAEVRNFFYSVRTFKTRSSRKGSAEIYIIAKNFTGGYNGT